MRKFLVLFMVCMLMCVPVAHATVSNSNSRTSLSADGIVDDFDFTFKIFEDSQVEVYLVEDADESNSLLQTLTTDYTVTLSSATEGGTVSMVSTPSSTFNVTMIRDVDYTQPTDLPVNAGFSERTLENAYDRIVMQTQQLKDLSDKSVKLPISSSATDIEFPPPEDGNVIVWVGTDGTTENQIYSTTALDAAVTAAQLAETNAETAETNAETAETNAETAETNAETAEINAAASAVAAALSASSIDGSIYDDDGDTGFDTERTTDDDTLRLIVAGTDMATIDSNGFQLTTTIAVNAIYDDDSFAADSNVALATQQSIKAYIAAAGTTEIFTANGTFTVPSGVTQVFVTMIAGGGGGGGALRVGNNQTAGGGGGAGAAIISQPVTVTPAQEIAIVIGAGGAGGIGNNSGSNGVNSVWDNGGSGQITVDHGNLGTTVQEESGVGGDGGVIPAANLSGDATDSPSASNSGVVVMSGMDGGDGGDGNVSPTYSGGGGGSIFGVGGLNASSNNGGAGLYYGAGGGGASDAVLTSRTGGAGADGIVIIRW